MTGRETPSELVRIAKGHVVEVRREGKGRPYIWLHSAFRGPMALEALFRHLKTNLELEGLSAQHFLPWLPGFGRSSPSSEPGVRPYEMADSIVNLIEKLELRAVRMIGYSLGANVAAIVANQLSDVIDKLVILGVAIEGSDLMVYRQLLSLTAAHDWDGIVHFTAQNLVGTKNREQYLKMAPLTRKQVSAKGFEEDLMRVLDSGTRLDVFPEVEKLSVPTLLISGLDDPFVPGREKREVLKHNPDIQMVLLEGVGHNDLVFPMQVDLGPYVMDFWRP
jgi:pimeloyl-ACP methyl ester carboxylesterase